MQKKIEFIAINTMIGIVAFLPIIANGYTNSMDGLWHSTHYLAGGWELSLGRWALPILDRLRGGYAAEPFCSLFSILLFAASAYLLTTMLDHRKHSILYAQLIIISTTACCYLSYRFTSIGYGLSFFFSVLAGRLMVKNNVSEQTRDKKIVNTFFAIILLVISLGLYQANIGCFCIIILGYLLYSIIKKEHGEWFLIAHSVIVFSISLILYKLAWDVLLKLTHNSASSYKGADKLSIFQIVKNLPNGILQAYLNFYHYFSFEEGFYVLRLLRMMIIISLFALTIVKPFFHRIEWKKIVIYEIIIALVPIASSVFCIFAPFGGELQMQMTGPLSIVIPLILCLIEIDFSMLVPCIMGGMLLFGNIFAVGADMDALRQGSQSSEIIMENIISNLINEDLMSDDLKCVFVGDICKSPLFCKNELWEKANRYAQFGNFGKYHETVVYSYAGLANEVGIEGIRFLSGNDYDEICASEVVGEMPIYPGRGSILREGDYVIIKVSNEY